MRIHRDERGQTIILVALSLPLLLGFIGIATDVGALFKDKRTMQTAADAAAIAAAQNLNYGTYVAAGKAASAANGFTDASNGVTVTISDPPTWTSSNFYNKSGYVEATVTKSESTLFLALFGHSSIAVQARAVATLGPGSTCVYTLGPTGADINVNNGASVNFSGCGILDDSNTSDALTVAWGSALTASSIGIVSPSWTNPHQGSITPPSPTVGIVPASDPLSYLSDPSYSTTNCSATWNINSSGTFTPASNGACYNGINVGLGAGGVNATINNLGALVINGPLIVGNGAKLTLGPGLYYINGVFTAQSGTTLSGTGVTFFMASPSGQVNIADASTINLTAPNSAGSTYNGILFWQPANNTNPVVIGQAGGGAQLTLEGAIYAPGAQLSISNGTGTNIYLDLVVKSLTAVGGSTLHSYESLSGVAPILTAPLLVE